MLVRCRMRQGLLATAPGLYLRQMARCRCCQGSACRACLIVMPRVTGLAYHSTGPASQAGGSAQVLPGERVPVDGEVVQGRGSCDEAMLTGESALVPKAPGAQVLLCS